MGADINEICNSIPNLNTPVGLDKYIGSLRIFIFFIHYNEWLDIIRTIKENCLSAVTYYVGLSSSLNRISKQYSALYSLPFEIKLSIFSPSLF
jgi:hypothetical protein